MRELVTEDEYPEAYADSIRIGMTQYTIALEFGMTQLADARPNEPPPTKRVALVRMSPQHALIFSKVLTKTLRDYQKQVGRIALPRELYEKMGLEPE